MMIVYTSQGVELFDTKNKDVYKEGTFGKIYHDGDKCHKVFNNAELFKIAREAFNFYNKQTRKKQ